MAADAHGVVVACAGADERLVVQIGYLDVLGADFDGAITRHREESMYSREMGIVGSDIDQAGIGSGQ